MFNTFKFKKKVLIQEEGKLKKLSEKQEFSTRLISTFLSDTSSVQSILLILKGMVKNFIQKTILSEVWLMQVTVIEN